MRNLFYDLPDEILHLIYKIYFSKYVLKEYLIHGFWEGLDHDIRYNHYMNKFTIWNGYTFEWRGQPSSFILTDNYGTKECPIECSYKVWKLNKNIK